MAGSVAAWRAARKSAPGKCCPSPLQQGRAARQVLALFGALLHGSLYLVLGATTLLPQALRAALRGASRQRTSLLQARACAFRSCSSRIACAVLVMLLIAFGKPDSCAKFWRTPVSGQERKHPGHRTGVWSCTAANNICYISKHAKW